MLQVNKCSLHGIWHTKGIIIAPRNCRQGCKTQGFHSWVTRVHVNISGCTKMQHLLNHIPFQEDLPLVVKKHSLVPDSRLRICLTEPVFALFSHPPFSRRWLCSTKPHNFSYDWAPYSELQIPGFPEQDYVSEAIRVTCRSLRRITTGWCIGMRENQYPNCRLDLEFSWYWERHCNKMLVVRSDLMQVRAK